MSRNLHGYESSCSIQGEAILTMIYAMEDFNKFCNSCEVIKVNRLKTLHHV
uniref:Uncharacterized protein n=1 Tax=Arundo donax TaxID=35708 RepID=A0A0A9H8U9_ARUDO